MDNRQEKLTGSIVGADLSTGILEIEVKGGFREVRVGAASVVVVDAADYADIIQRFNDLKPRCHRVYIGEDPTLKGLRCESHKGHDGKLHFDKSGLRYWVDGTPEPTP